MFHKVPKTLGISLALFFSLFLGMLQPVMAASQPVITQVGVISGKRIQLQIDFLPPNMEFTVTEGPAGSHGVGNLIAHFSSLDGGTKIYWFEVLTSINTDANIDVRIDNGAGIFAFATVANTATFTAPTTIPVASVPVSTTPLPVQTNPVPSAPAISTIGQISIAKVEFGGIVAVNLNNLPPNTTFTVTINSGGTQAIGNYLVGQLTTSSTVTSTTAIFEIPVGVRFSNVLDLRLQSGSFVYLIEFNNQNFNN